MAAGSQERGTWLGSLPRRASRAIWRHQVESLGLGSRAQRQGGLRGALRPIFIPCPGPKCLWSRFCVAERNKRLPSAPYLHVILGESLSLSGSLVWEMVVTLVALGVSYVLS